VSPAEEYKRRLAERESRVAHFEKIHIQLGNTRLVLAIVAAAMLWFVLRRHAFAGWWLLAPVAAFIAVAAYHSRILRKQELANRAASFYRAGIARIEDRWAGHGQTGERFNDPHHVYAADLDIFGKCSLFELLSTCRTRSGEDTLARWLLAPASVEEILHRQAAVAELREQLDLREALAVLGEDAGVGVHPEELVKWAESPNQLKPGWIRWAAPVMAALAIAAVIVSAIWGLLSPLVLGLIVEALLIYRLRKSLDLVLHGTEHAFRDLGLLTGILERIEVEKFQSPRLRALQEQIRSHKVAASHAMSRLRTLVDFIDSRDNLILKIVDVPLMYSVQVAFAAEGWRREHGQAVRRWLNAVGEVEALLSLATYSYEHPSDPFPEFTNEPASIAAEQIGHPLIAEARCVRNDVEISGDTRVLLVSGSNMSGKSTLMRAIGINTVLTMAGGAVRARNMRLSPLSVAASIRINDSLQEGSSRFYAEITRLRQIFDLADGPVPLLFLLDEVLQGTNSTDRRIGAQGIVRALIDRGAIGMVSTHDLALTEIGQALNGRLRNVHFQDEIENGRMKFDYKLREGVVTKSNGLELMRSIGLKV
jgi:MutS-like protein